MEEKRQENKMGTAPVGELLVKMSMPIVVSMLVQALYNIVDSAFVAQISQNALAAVSLAFPIQNLIIAVGVGTAVGVNSLVARKLGERRFEDANKAATNGILLAVLSGLVFAIFGFLFSRTFFAMFTKNEEILWMGTDYLSVCTIFSFGCFVQMTAERILQATGKTFYTMITQGTGAIINIILDPILIFGLLGFPKMGVKGAAIATVFGQIVGMILALYFNVRINKEIKIQINGFKPSKRIIGEIYKVGIPSILMQSIGTVMTIGMNKILIAFSETAISVFGVYFKLQSFIFMPVFGFTCGLVPIVGYNFGAGNKERIKHVVRDCLVYCTGIMILGVVIFELFTPQLLSMFNASYEMLDIGVPALRIICVSFLGAGAGIVFSSVFQAVGNGMFSLIITICRQLVVILPAAYMLSKLSLNAVWFAFPIAEAVSLTMGIFIYRYVYKTEIEPLIPLAERTHKPAESK